ncbi:helix-turn-helix domain-containing protein [Hymenobacter sp. 15J16-1T3B]|uniref:helix-turn-helix domain-containing protein n=1 Tax=Hymenobacter sp. 15J16-1T3B TaxID=2886941 RepID=UPI001D0FCCE4|nr:helix-turn-helix domain-containing protein [Hymenobacter sp. 15J16-1T3B]MCC3155601.1 helix-turn-helix domain-containing protein [Hymenobacter sp. 15J16-1T3B]
MKLITLTLDQLQEELGALLDARFAQVLQALRQAPAAEAEYLTTRQALAFVHLSKPTLNKLRREGRITAYHSSDKRVLYRRSELVAYLDASKPKEGHQPC